MTEGDRYREKHLYTLMRAFQEFAVKILKIWFRKRNYYKEK